MDLHDHGLRKYGARDILRSSAACDWTGIGAELRHHPAAELPPIDLVQTEIGVATRCHLDAVVTRKGDGVWQTTPVVPGTIWTCPAGVREEDISLRAWHDCLHIYLPTARFAELSDVRGGATVEAHQIRYVSDLQDALIRQVAWTLLEELQAPTAAGRVLAETLAMSLTARLVQICAGPSLSRERGLPVRPGRDDARLARVLDYMTAHIEEEIGVDELAAVACLSSFHFIRMFRARMGAPPSRDLSRMRLEHAKTLLAQGRATILEIALACCFSSQANFTRSFRRSTGVTPGAYRGAL